MTNSIVLPAAVVLTVLSTNWVTDSVTTDVHTGKQTLVQHAEVTEKHIYQQVSLCTNRWTLSEDLISTNAAKRITDSGQVVPSPLPTLPTGKE